MPPPQIEEVNALLFSEAHADYPAWRRSFLFYRLRLGLGIALVIFLSFIFLNLSRYPDEFNTTWFYLNLTQIGALLLCALFLHSPWGRLHPGPALIWLSCTITLLPQLEGIISGIARFDAVTWTLVFLGQATLMPVHWRLHLLSQGAVLGVYFSACCILNLEPLHPVADSTFQYLYLSWFCIICNVSVYLYEHLQRAEFEAREQLKAEREKSEHLLLNILPLPIAERLKSTTHTIADDFTEVSVLFADLVGFTQLSSRLEPPRVVELLNDIFSRFDNLVERHGLEKIKTIGDAYMVVAGLPEPIPIHSEKIALLALDMRQSIRDFNTKHGQNLNIRIGIHSGPVVAGVIGIKKFAYDLWGDTVNIASRMESHGIPDHIQVSEEVHRALRGKFRFQERGLVEIKGKGELRTYFLE